MGERIMKALLVAVVVAAMLGAVYSLSRRGEASFESPRPGTWHLRPLDAEVWLERELPEREGWRRTGYEVAVPAAGSVTVTLTDRGVPLHRDIAVREAGVEIIGCGVRRLELAQYRERFPAEVSAKVLDELDGAAAGREGYEWKLVRVFRPRDGAPAEPVTSGGPIPLGHAPRRGSRLSSGRLGLLAAPYYLTAARGEAVALQDWIALPPSFKAFDRRYPHLPDEAELVGASSATPSASGAQGRVAVTALESPVWRLAVSWSPSAG